MRRTIRLRSIVALLVFTIVAPLGLLAVLSVQRVWRRQLANVDRQNVATVRAISVAVDQHIDRTTAALDVLGELHALDGPDYAAFENLATRILPYQSHWSSILLADPGGRVLDGVPNTEDGGARVNGEPWAQATAKTARTTVSNVFSLPGDSKFYLIIATPVVRQGKVALVLGARVDSRSFGAILRQQEAPPSGAVAIVDAEHRIVARNVDEEKFVGQVANQPFIEASGNATTSAWRAAMPDGRPTYAAFTRSARSGLRTGLGLPSEEVDGPIRRILLTFAAVWTAVLTLGAILGLFLGGIITRALSSASNAATSLARGEVVDAPPSWIREIDELASSLRRAVDTLRDRNRERDEASRLKDEFLMTISHELRTPLTAICGWANMLATGQIREAQRPRAVASIERNAVALHQLVDDLLDVSRIVAGKVRLEVQRVELPDLAASAVDTIRPAAEAKGIHVSTALGHAGSPVPGDPARLQQVIWNLLSNAVKFTPPGGRIDVSCERKGDRVELAVRDSGIGIDPKFLPFVFDRFRQAASGTTRAHGGLGLGLSIVRDLVELHGGRVSAVNNAPDPGSTFLVELPALPVSATTAPTRYSADEAPSLPENATPPSVPETSPTPAAH